MVGNWSGKYDDGISPYAWNGSSSILEEFLKKRKGVKYGQCWTFSAIATTGIILNLTAVFIFLLLDTSINRIWISKTSIVTECWISRNSHQWSTRLATQRPLTPYQVSIITNQSKQSLDEFKQQGFSQACLTPLMRYWCLQCLHSFFFIMKKEKKINSFTAVYHCSHRKSIRYSL